MGNHTSALLNLLLQTLSLLGRPHKIWPRGNQTSLIHGCSFEMDAESDSDESMEAGSESEEESEEESESSEGPKRKGSAKPKGNPKSKGAKKPSRATNKKAKGKKDEKNKPAKKKSRASNKGDDQLFRYKSWRVVPDTWISFNLF